MSDSNDAIHIDGFGELNRIGRGGFATVYRARDLRLGRQVAIKVLDGSDNQDDRLGRFRREAAAMADLSWHPNIAAVHSFGTLADERPYLVMEYLQDGSFADRLRKSGPIDPALVLPIAQQLADALVAVHGSGIVHRDLKPSNVLIGRRGEAKLADFGIAGISGGDHTTVGTFVGTALHSAPEVMKGEMATPASDLWSLASTLFTLINGRAPFSDPNGDHNPVAMLYRAMNNPLPDFRQQPPAALAEGIRRCLLVDPDDRPASAADLVRILGAEGNSSSPATDPTGGETGSGDASASAVGRSALASDRNRRAAESSAPDVLPADRVHPSVDTPDERGARQVKRASGGTAPVPIVTSGGAPRPVKPEPVRPPQVAQEPSTPANPVPVVASASDRVERPASRQRQQPPASRPPTRPPVAPPARPPTPTYWKGIGFLAVLLLAVAAYVLFRLITGGDDGSTVSDTDASVTELSTAVGDNSAAEGGALPPPPEGFERYDGTRFSADVPVGWTITTEDRDQGYGFRTRWEAPNGDFVFVDANKTKGGLADPEASAREISGTMDAPRILVQPRREDELSEDGDLAWSFEFTALRNSDERRIDIFSSESGHGFAVVAGSTEDADVAFEAARQIVRSFRTNLE